MSTRARNASQANQSKPSMQVTIKQSKVKKASKQSRSQIAKQSYSQPASQPTAEQTYQTIPKTKDYDPPCLANFIVRMMRMRMIQKVALNSLKIGYVQVKTPKFPKPCSLACNCKIIWVSDSGKVGELSRKFQSYPLGEAFSKITLNFNSNKDFPVN